MVDEYQALLLRLKFVRRNSGVEFPFAVFTKKFSDRLVAVYLGGESRNTVYHLRYYRRQDTHISQFSTVEELELAIIFESLRPLMKESRPR